MRIFVFSEIKTLMSCHASYCFISYFIDPLFTLTRWQVDGLRVENFDRFANEVDDFCTSWLSSQKDEICLARTQELPLGSLFCFCWKIETQRAPYE